MPQAFSHPAVHSDGDNRTFDELRRDAELGLDTVRQEVRRSKETAPTEQSSWPIARVKKTLERMRKARDADTVVTNRISIELAQLEGELEKAKKTWLVGSSQQAGSGGLSVPLSETASEDEVRRKLLQGHQRLNETDRELGLLERNVADSLRMGRAAQTDLEEQGEDLMAAHREGQTIGSAAREAARTIKRMTTRALYNRLFLYFVIFLLLIADGLFIYFGYIKN